MTNLDRAIELYREGQKEENNQPISEENKK